MSNEFRHDPPREEASAPADLPPPEEGNDLPPQWKPDRRLGPFKILSRFMLLGILLAVVILPFTPFAGKIHSALTTLVERARETKFIVREIRKPPIIKEVIREVPAPPPPLPSKFVPRKESDIATLFNGINIRTTLETTEGTYATLEANDPLSYMVDFQVKVRVPKANNSITELARVNPHLPKMLPGLDPLLATGKISGFYHKLYENKVNIVERNITRLNKILDRHNFFDCETILELEHPQSKRRALLIQSDMDVVADGSDGDRMSSMDASIYNSDYYQPFTSYVWAKQSTTPNPLLSKWQAKLEAAKKERSGKGGKSSDLKSQIQNLEADIHGLKTRSSLIAEKDPFVVIPLLFKDYPRIMPQAPNLGDYCAVIHGSKIYPAICGDYGPNMKMGEASLIIAKKINDHATANIRGEDDLKVTYLIFPGTADHPFGPPNLDKWYEKIAGYLKDIGGLGAGYELHKWENPFPPKPPPTPAADVIAKNSTDAKAITEGAPPVNPAAALTPSAPGDNPAAGTSSTVTVNPTPAADAPAPPKHSSDTGGKSGKGTGAKGKKSNN